MTPDEIRQLDREGRLYKFYKTHEWLNLKAAILREHHGECAWCRERGVITPAVTVHHVMHVKTHPELALSRTYRDKDGTVKDNLIPLCHECHDRAHERMRFRKKPEPLTPERW